MARGRGRPRNAVADTLPVYLLINDLLADGVNISTAEKAAMKEHQRSRTAIRNRHEQGRAWADRNHHMLGNALRLFLDPTHFHRH